MGWRGGPGSLAGRSGRAPLYSLFLEIEQRLRVSGPERRHCDVGSSSKKAPAIAGALDIAPKIKSGVVWINSTNLFDAAAGFGGYRESGYGREGGREGMWE